MYFCHLEKNGSPCYCCCWYFLGFAWFAWTKRIRWLQGGFVIKYYQLFLVCKAPLPLKTV